MARIKRIQPKTAQDDSKALKEENLKLKAVIVHLEAKVDEFQTNAFESRCHLADMAPVHERI